MSDRLLSANAAPLAGFEVAFPGSDGGLSTASSGGNADWNLGMAARTSPSITSLSGGGYETAFEANDGSLWTVGAGGWTDWKLGVARGTGPSIASLPRGGFEVAFEANDGSLWTVGTGGWTDWKLGVAPGTGPSIASLPRGGFEVAFEANTGALWTVGIGPDARDADWSLEVMPGTSASVAAAEPLAGRIVAVDPGHNGGNAAAGGVINQLVWNGREWETCDTTGSETDSGYTEAEFNFNVAEYLVADLQSEGATVVLTRPSNSGVGPCVTERAAIGNNAHADAAISIHADGGPPAGRGFTILEPVADGPNNAVTGQSQALGVDIRAAFQAEEPISNYDGIDGIQPRNDLAGLNLTTVPKVLIETGNMRNSIDAALLTTSEWQQKAAEALAAGLTAYLTQ